MPETTLQIAIVGAGAVGLGLGSGLARVAAGVHFVTRTGQAAEALRARGIQRRGLFGDVDVAGDRISAAASLASAAERPLDFLLVCTKSTASPALAVELSRLWKRWSRPPRVVLCQNGWGNAEHFTAQLPSQSIYNARIITGFRRNGATEVEITVHADAVRIGSLFGAATDGVAPLCRAIALGGVPCEVSPEIERDLWAKMLYNCALNPLGALLGVPYGELGERAESRAIMREVVREIFQVLEASGHCTHWPDAESYLEVFYRDLLPPTSAHESSMLLDLRSGNRSEIDVLSGAVAGLARRHAVDAPVNAALAALIRAIDVPDLNDP